MELVFATNNAHKLREVKAILGESINIISLKEAGVLDELPENQDTLEGNASEKAWYVYNKTGKDCFADDTGLEVEALDGRPGVYSARYAGEGKNSHDNVVKLLSELEGQRNRKARFRTVISLIIGGTELLFDGTVEGDIILKPAGGEGFGYDPVFLPQGFDQTFAEMSEEQKNTISHRYRAVLSMKRFINRF
ncbi:MAG: RdgB/HAM1 family non-canonical purine NTP pyrophosphatase [Bacteroidales bacterium]|nr:RdgB/HAM1 family non-canonical purine NTP pyrophosphatase [Bacteroidales bacterium]